jgi:hypothetical protein
MAAITSTPLVSVEEYIARVVDDTREAPQPGE